jgi:small subunit ribosomal protein S11e
MLNDLLLSCLWIRLIKGYVKTNKMKRSVIVRRDYLHYIKKYNRFEKRHTNIPAHLSPAFRINEGDDVVIGQCRPLSKTIRYNVLKIERKADSAGKSFDKF